MFAQENTLEVKYMFYSDNSDSGKSEYAVLLNSQNKSLFVVNSKIIDPNTRYLDENRKITGDLIDYKVEIYKDFDKNRYYSMSPITKTTKFVLKDSLNHLKWVIDNNVKKVILNYSCTKATTHFRGRNYVAYFTDEVPINDGPWKMNGLPGLILELYEQSGKLEILAYELNVKSENKNITTKLDIKNAFFWHELIEKAKTRFKEIAAQIKMNDPNASFTIDGSRQLELHEDLLE